MSHLLNLFSQTGLYDIHIKLQQIPFLHCEPHLNNTEIDEDETIFVQVGTECYCAVSVSLIHFY